MAASLITDRVKQLVRMRGPVIPSQISKEIGTNILMASAILSELASKNDVKISSVKFGGTPLYYVPGQEAKLQNYLTSLPLKEKEAFEKIKASGVLLDTALDPATRFAMRQLKDFAKPLEVNADGEAYLFWKWYLLANEEAEVSIKKILGLTDEKPANEEAPAPKIEAVVGTQTTIPSAQPAVQPIQPKVQQQMPLPTASKLQPVVQSATQASEQYQLIKPTRKKATAQTTPTEFTIHLDEFFAKSSIEVESSDLSGKSEAQYVVLLPSPVGKLRYYCIAKNKKTCTDTDISSALVQGQLRKLPVLLLTKGELSKKAQELLSKEIGAIVVKRI